MQGKLEEAEQERELLQQSIEKQAKRLNSLTARMKSLSDRENKLQAILVDTQERFLSRDEEMQSTIYELQVTLAALQENAPNAYKNRDASDKGLTMSKSIAYQQLIRRIRDVVRTTLPREARVIVVSKGDEQLLKLYGRRGSHFPQNREGVYAGYYPHDSTAAIVQLEVLRSQGGEYLLFPETSFWWLDKYVDFRRHLERQYRVITRQKDTCVIFALRRPAAWTEFEAVIAEYQNRLDSDPAILDWSTGLNLAKTFSEYSIFSPACDESSLPYISQSVDIVAVSSADPSVLKEAHRVARHAVVRFGDNLSGLESVQTLAVDWKSHAAESELPTTSVIIPCYNQIAYTEACLSSLQETLPRNFRGEIIIVDDASTDETPSRLKEWVRIGHRVKIIRNRKNSGFLMSASRGARAASGEILLFLNNDTVMLPGWLPPMLRVFRDFPEAGVVGGKLIFADGTLQEAGGVVFCDGSAANFGRGDHETNAPLYNFVREVDYCSGALFATPRALFNELGGFDAQYQPAYYEDTDYCFKIRKHGYRVYYQPESAIIHLEGATSGTDLSRGVKQYQVVNHEKFRKKWDTQLKRQPARPEYSDLGAWRALALRSEVEGVEKR